MTIGSKVLDPINSAFILPEVQGRSDWWEGRRHFVSPVEKYIFIYVGAPLHLVVYNGNRKGARLNPIGLLPAPDRKGQSQL
jgi:hypothetical protein